MLITLLCTVMRRSIRRHVGLYFCVILCLWFLYLILSLSSEIQNSQSNAGNHLYHREATRQNGLSTAIDFEQRSQQEDEQQKMHLDNNRIHRGQKPVLPIPKVVESPVGIKLEDDLDVSEEEEGGSLVPRAPMDAPGMAPTTLPCQNYSSIYSLNDKPFLGSINSFELVFFIKMLYY